MKNSHGVNNNNNNNNNNNDEITNENIWTWSWKGNLKLGTAENNVRRTNYVKQNLITHNRGARVVEVIVVGNGHEFKSWTRLIAFHVALITLGKV